MAKAIFYENVFLSKFGFWRYNFRSRNARNPIKGTADSNYGLVSNKTLSQKLAHWVYAQGLMTSAKIV